MLKPNFHRLWLAFPDHNQYRSMQDLYTTLGGAAEKNIKQPGFGPNGNTCASRLSIAFNKAGAPINMALANTVGAQTSTAWPILEIICLSYWASQPLTTPAHTTMLFAVAKASLHSA